MGGWLAGLVYPPKRSDGGILVDVGHLMMQRLKHNITHLNQRSGKNSVYHDDQLKNT